ncbi:MAG: SDR family NAD(P)-dependent oxidoreductase [Bacilli bacterium]|nr:SDR family NAD(P)-dependent oxidoreductase [Bacilli bacterium]
MIHKRAVKYLNKFNFTNVEGKTILITGGNSGIGFMSARYACYLKMKVIIACRSQKRGEEAIQKLKEEFPESDVKLMLLDMSEEQSIKNFVNKIKEEKIDIDVLYHNAGVYRLPYQIKENKELVVSTNYFGPYILMSLLLDYLHELKHEIKVVFTSSIAAKWAKNNIDMLAPTEKVSRMTRYCNSKLLDAYLFKYLYENDKSNVQYYLTHPGVTGTALFSKAYKNKFFVALTDGFMKVMGNPLWKSSLSIARVIENYGKSGLFYGPTHLFNWRGYPKVNKFLNKSYKHTDEIIKRSEEMTGYKLMNK